MRRTPLHSHGQRGHRERSGQIKISPTKVVVKSFLNSEEQAFDDEAMENLLGFFELLIAIDREQKTKHPPYESSDQ